MHLFRVVILFLIVFCVMTGTLHAKSKNKYWLFNPTPRNEMRPIAMDRPDKTETPHTVDAGHVQAEVSLFAFIYDWHTDDSTHVNGYSILPMLLKVGVTNWMDVELGLEPYIHNSTISNTTNSKDLHNGFGDVVPRLKINFMGNDSGSLALGTIAFIKVPTNQDGISNHSYEGGVLFPFGWEIDDQWSFNGQPQFNIVNDSSTGGHTFEFSGTLDIARSFTDRFGAFLEFFAAVSAEAGQSWVGTVDAGMTYELVPDYLVIDAALDMGVTRSADDMNALFGFTFRY